ncbi:MULTISPECIES: hypothetical protein [Yersinia pseudotuberculosis complex]|uniref:hypothetical protein n=1 Tax=Yersinia pseudotuberculosis complex TaxID=1649845 RepID=UPI0012BBB993|nr:MULTISPECIES: hypothetical protein [Yersinia pseudotuberculosis complex]MBP0072623.1 hypothetical protein [Yersinia pseudotuberculosis]
MIQTVVRYPSASSVDTHGLLLLSTLNSDIDLTSARLNATNLQLDSGRDLILRTASEQ